MASYFIRIDTFWQNSPDRFVGPFYSRSDAQAEIDRAIDAPNSKVIVSGQSARDIRYGIRVHGIYPCTVCKRNYGMNERNTLSHTMPLSTDDLTELEDAYLAY